MKLAPSDPDIQTIVRRLEDGDIDLQPDFQRGEVWSEPKKRRLIDSVLRDWHIPPIHVVEVPETAKDEVLDGQQRLRAIWEFARGELLVDGNTEPLDTEIVQLDGKTYLELPDTWRRRYDRFTIRLFRISQYQTGEPGELFFRLNQPTSLTPAEQRNAFYGRARQQVKELVALMALSGLETQLLGFSNSRMAYDDVIARLCESLSAGTLQGKVTATTITVTYRSPDRFTPTAIERAKKTILDFSSASRHFGPGLRFNKATLYSWLCFCAEVQTPKLNPELPSETLGAFIR